MLKIILLKTLVNYLFSLNNINILLNNINYATVQLVHQVLLHKKKNLIFINQNQT